MAKDPAFLFYDGDAAKDVSHLNRLERGCYFDLIQAQRKFGRLSINIIKKILAKDFELCWESVKICLTYDKDMYFIQWVEDSVIKRKEYSESRRKNRKSSLSTKLEKTYDNHMENEIVIENINEDEIIKGGAGENWNTKPGEKEFSLELPDIKSGAVIQQFKISKHTDVSAGQVESIWAIFKAQHFTGDKFYRTKNEAFSHFINWSKSQTIEKNGTDKQTFRAGKNPGNNQIAAGLAKKLSIISGGT